MLAFLCHLFLVPILPLICLVVVFVLAFVLGLSSAILSLLFSSLVLSYVSFPPHVLSWSCVVLSLSCLWLVLFFPICFACLVSSAFVCTCGSRSCTRHGLRCGSPSCTRHGLRNVSLYVNAKVDLAHHPRNTVGEGGHGRASGKGRVRHFAIITSFLASKQIAAVQGKHCAACRASYFTL